MKLQGAVIRSCRHAPFSGRTWPSLPAQRPRLSVRANENSGKVWGAEEENAAQVRRLISRDRKEFLGNAEGDILEKFKVELGGDSVDASPSNQGPVIGANTPNPFASGSAAGGASSPFSSAPVASPFTSSPSASPFKSSIEPAGLRPDMSPDPITKETPISFLKSITLTQVVLFCSFSTIILLMLATFNVVLNSGAIRLAGID